MLTTKIVCDCCGEDGLYHRVHLAVTLHPTYPGSTKALHFCDLTCVARFSTNMTAAIGAHADGWTAHRTARRAAQ